MSEFCFGVDVGGTSVKFGLFDEKGKLLDRWMCPTRLENMGQGIIPDIRKGIQHKIAERGIHRSQIQGIGIGIPGQADKKGDVLVAENLGWENVALASELEKSLGIPVKVENDANAAALGELKCGSAKGVHSVILVTIGTGIGCGIVLNGEILRGKNGAAGELGHMHVEDAVKKKCSCGNRGCLEQVASARGISAIAEYILETTKENSELRGQEISAKKVLDAAKKKDKVAVQAVEHFGIYLGKALAACTCLLDPEVIVLGGGVSKAGQIVIECVQRHYRKYAFMECKNIRFCLASLGNDAGIYGAAQLGTGYFSPQ